MVSSNPSTTEPFAKRAIFPVSSVTTRDPTSNSSLNDSRILVPADAAAGEPDGAMPRPPEQMVRNPKARHARKLGREDDLARLTIDDIYRERERGFKRRFNAPVIVTGAESKIEKKGFSDPGLVRSRYN